MNSVCAQLSMSSEVVKLPYGTSLISSYGLFVASPVEPSTMRPYMIQRTGDKQSSVVCSQADTHNLSIKFSYIIKLDMIIFNQPMHILPLADLSLISAIVLLRMP